ncbi:glutamate synthase large subunit [Oceanobacillus bengalensis]|uniref:Glutamate synthase large subunit n=1 Tax=Oceanobacillus bengalensis TaxID=1435466 RepID=A0A494YS86_9BACI|nr:glutamate synthase large subunit [Oceanobacillus bengalensis]RKQ12421.1 glutamate synthase large subunit [Oceanobacillus bengalensis]
MQRWTAENQGMYDSSLEHDACGIAMLANINGNRTHTIVNQALTALERLDHRGGHGDDSRLGDGAGILTQIPHKLFELEWGKVGKQLVDAGMYGVGMFFLPSNETDRKRCEDIIENMIEKENITLFGWRTVPTDDSDLPLKAIETQPVVRQVFVLSPYDKCEDIRFERKLYEIRKKIEQELIIAGFRKDDAFHLVSFSARTVIYKGLLLPKQLRDYFIDLNHTFYESSMAMVHNRFSTNTFPSWHRAQPNRYIMHNGEINTINGNVNWMNAREALFKTDVLDIEHLRPIVDLDGSDSAMFDNTLEFLVLSGWSVSHAMMMMIPEAWNNNELMDEGKKAFYQYHSTLMEPWDGPAAMVFTDGKQIGACLDRNGLRPARYMITEDDFICVASEVGVVDIPEEKIICKDRLKPGQMLLIDLEEGHLYDDEEIKQRIVSERPYEKLVEQNIIPLENLPKNILQRKDMEGKEMSTLRKQSVFGYTNEEWEKVVKPMALHGKEPTGSMGYDGPLAVLSEKPQLLFNYFKQKFAQVTNPPIDAIREESITSVEVMLGSNGNLLHPTKEYKKIRLKTPILSGSDMHKLQNLQTSDWKTISISTLFPVEGYLQKALDELLQMVDSEVANGSNIIILSDRKVNKENVAIPSLLAVSAVHHHLIHTGYRSKVSLIVESGEPREVHHFAALLGYGANAIHPYLVYESFQKLVEENEFKFTFHEVSNNYVKAVTKGILKILSKMGISTIQSYIGAQIFEALGISKEVIDRYFPRTSSKIGGLTLADISKETRVRHTQAYRSIDAKLETGSDFQWRHDGEKHLYQPKTIHTLQQAVRTGNYDLYKKYSNLLNEELSQQTTLRGLLDFKPKRKPIPIEEVESIEFILKRFKTGAMSFGSISKEAHEALAIAMNRIGGMSNSGEGGEDPERFIPLENGDSKCSKIKQVASGRFGVTSHYLVNSEEIQIKMAQGAKPGEGGQLAGHKVTAEVAKTRGVTPGIELISPPPHHDIYSIEDLAQLIYDLKNANPKARINVKLVSAAGVGTIAAGVAKAKADVILISGYDGGTGAASRSSIKHTGMPWELGLAEAEQTLKRNGLRKKVTLETDGKMMNGRDVVIAALLGAEEYGFSTLPLVALGCVMMRVCHLDTCPVGIATQNPILRKNMVGTADQVVYLMQFIAEEIREYMAELGFRTLDEMIGRTDLLEQKQTDHWKAQKLDLSAIIQYQESKEQLKVEQDHELEQTLDCRELLPMYDEALTTSERMNATLPIRNTNRSVGTRLGSEISSRFGVDGLAEDRIKLAFNGSAGQSFGAFLPKGVTLHLEGDANDYVGKGLSGGKLIINPSRKSTLCAEENIIVGNAIFYGATDGKGYIRGVAGERFCVRNSGANVVVEGIGDHGCEYMTGGRAIILGEVGKNFAAGMSGGIAYVLAPERELFQKKCNQELVFIEAIEDKEEIRFLKKEITKHYQYTQSTVAREILESWDYHLSQFIRVIPKEYRRILTEQQQDRFLQVQLNL